jgi:pimeloyl-ACP methyl ester carboxylesterase
MFVQGARDPLCPLDLLEAVRKRMRAPSTLYVVEGGDHSLMVAKTALKALGSSQEQMDDGMLTAIARFLKDPLE